MTSAPAIAGLAPVTAPPQVGKWTVVFSIAIGSLMAMIDTSIVNVAMPQIRGELGASLQEITWVTTAYMIAMVLIMPLTGFLGADNALYSADFRATERMAALLFQVAGRAGRAELPGEVIVQTDFAAHPIYRALGAHDFDGLAEWLLAERRVAGMPPFGHLALLAAESAKRSDVDAFLAAAHSAADTAVQAGRYDVDVYSPVPAGLERRAEHHAVHDDRDGRPSSQQRVR
jgi:hypothetical protein